MTLEVYDPQRLDNLALRLLDLAAALRKMSNLCRDENPEGFQLHDRKALEWLSRLDEWTIDTSLKLDRALIRTKARQKALKTAASPAPGAENSSEKEKRGRKRPT
jgi:hypothetical protein